MIGGLWKSTGGAALLTAAGLYLGSVGMSPAQAADLGGDCCADLEERVAELEATTARKGNRRVSLTISGQVSTAVMAWDSGDAPNEDNFDSSDVYVVDGTYNGGTFVSFTGSARINPNVSAGFQVVLGMDVGARSHQVNQLDDDGQVGGRGGADNDIVMTLSNWYLDHKQLGRLTVGRINTSTAGITTIDLGGAGVVANASIGYTVRGFHFISNDNAFTGAGGGWSQMLGGNTVNSASLSRANAVQYTTPSVGGFSASASWGEDDVSDISLRYAGEFSGFRVAAGIGYISNSSGTNEVLDDHLNGDEPSQVKGSASILHVSSGLYLTGAFVDQDGGTESVDANLWYVQGGISKNWTGLGKTVLYGEYANVESEDIVLTNIVTDADFTRDASADMWGVGVVQHIDAAAMELYLSYRNFSAECSPCIGPGNDFSVVLGGARIRF
jgi:hypothetical protein